MSKKWKNLEEYVKTELLSENNCTHPENLMEDIMRQNRIDEKNDIKERLEIVPERRCVINEMGRVLETEEERGLLDMRARY